MELSLFGILIEDVMGYKKDAPGVYIEVLIPKGSLLKAL